MTTLDPATIVDLARKTLEIDEKPSAILPPYYLASFTKHVAQHPNDTNFILELAKPGKKGSPVGGNGFGIATCLEDYCWTDVRLGADPALPDGGKANGFGSLWEYQVHCDKDDHKRGRDERCRKAGITYQPTSSANHASAPASRSSQAGPSNAGGPGPSRTSALTADLGSHRLQKSSSSQAGSQSSRSTSSHNTSQSQSQRSPKPTQTVGTKGLSQPSRSAGVPAGPGVSSSSVLRPTTKHNLPSSSSGNRDVKPDIRPLSSQNAVAGPSRPPMKSIFELLDSADDEVSVIRTEDIPDEYRRKSNRHDPVILSDDESDTLPSSSSTGRQPLASVSMAKAKPKALVGRSSQGDRDVFAEMMEERIELICKIPRPHSRAPAESARQPLARAPFHTPDTHAVKPEIKPGIPAPVHAPQPPASTLPGTYPPPLLAFNHAGPSNALLSTVPSTSMPSTVTSAVAANMQAGVSWIKQERDALLLREIDAVNHLRIQVLALSADIDKQALLRDIISYTHSLSTLRFRPSTEPFPDLPPSIPQHFPWFGASSAKVREKHEQYQAAEAALDVAGVLRAAGFTSRIPSGPGRMLGSASQDNAEDAMLEAEYGYEYDRPTDLQEFFQHALNDFSDDQDIDKALRTLGLTDIQQKFADMTVTLLPHQILGVAFMLEKEKDRRFRGGLLCDAMGLGKTVQTIAVIAGNQSEDRRVRTTLIVAPLAVLTQWKNEIESKTAARLFKVHIHHGANKTKNVATFKNVDVVLTTYGTLVADFADPKKKAKKRKSAQDGSDIEEDDAEPPKKKGPIFRMDWYRVVLDEAHGIRNRDTKVSRAAADLEAVHRWSLTGTLINNKLDDIFPHLRFLGISPQAEWSEFNKHICRVVNKRPKLATNRAQAILKTCMMRRHKESTLNGVRLLQLPPKETTIEELDFAPEERLIYEQVEQRMKIKFGKFLKEGTVLKHMSCVLTMLMRLRQLTCHPWLLRRNPGDPAHPNDFEVSDEDLYSSLNIEPTAGGSDLINAIKQMGEDWVADIVKKLKDRYHRMVNAPKRDEEAEKDNECSICLDIFTDEAITSCKHSFCRACINEIYENAPRDAGDITDEQAARGMRKCPLCRSVIEKSRTYAAVAFFDPEKQEEDKEEKPVIKDEPDRKGKRKSLGDDDGDFEDVKPDIKKPNNKGKDKVAAEPDPEPESDAEEMELDAIERVLPSTKMKMLGTLLETYLAEDGVKVIIFSEFVSYLNLCSIFLDQQQIAHHIYHGQMRQKDREGVIRDFTAPITDDNPARVILISRKAGGAGLNLTVASKVISLDLAWNAAAENQAVDRAHRIGQTRPVDIRRLVIKDTVEQRILDLQARKEALSDGAMGEGTGGRLGRLSVQDLMRLFNYDTDE